MITRLKLKPGQRGTKKLLAEHGDALVCVRYRYDEPRKKRLKTIELVIEESDWRPPKLKFRDDDLVSVQIGFSDKELREAAKAARGRWVAKTAPLSRAVRQISRSIIDTGRTINSKVDDR